MAYETIQAIGNATNAEGSIDTIPHGTIVSTVLELTSKTSYR